jgi:hypothetical protein
VRGTGTPLDGLRVRVRVRNPSLPDTNFLDKPLWYIIRVEIFPEKVEILATILKLCREKVFDIPNIFTE